MPLTQVGVIGSGGGVYKIVNARTGRVYIGSTNNFQQRFNEHYYRLSNGTHHNIALYNDFRLLYDLRFIVVQRFFDTSPERLRRAELAEMAKYSPFQLYNK